MDAGSSLIFIGLAVAWAVYLLPVALRHHHESDRSRVVETFSHRMRVLAHRAPVDARTTELVTPGQPQAKPAPSPAARRAAAKRATKRRRNVLALILLATAAATGVAAFGLIDWWYVAIPAGLLVAWLVACRIMVKGERKAMSPAARMPIVVPVEKDTPEEPAEPADQAADAEMEVDPMADTSTGLAAVVDPTLWDPVPVTLPTYVTKPTATRSVRTIAFDDTGVWTSGRTDADAQIAREADEAEKAARQKRDEGERATGS